MESYRKELAEIMSIPSIYNIDRRNLFMQYNPKAVLCLHSALAEQGYTTFNDIAPYVFAKIDKPCYSTKVNLIPNIFGDADINLIHDRKCTSIERTICECIYWEVQIDVILEALAEYNSDHRDFRELLEKAKEYKVSVKLIELLDSLQEYYKE